MTQQGQTAGGTKGGTMQEGQAGFQLTPQQLTEIQTRYLHPNTNPVCNRALVVMLAGRGNWTADQIAEFLGVPQTTVEGYLNGWKGQGIESFRNS